MSKFVNNREDGDGASNPHAKWERIEKSQDEDEYSEARPNGGGKTKQLKCARRVLSQCTWHGRSVDIKKMVHTAVLETFVLLNILQTLNEKFS